MHPMTPTSPSAPSQNTRSSTSKKSLDQKIVDFAQKSSSSKPTSLASFPPSRHISRLSSNSSLKDRRRKSKTSILSPRRNQVIAFKLKPRSPRTPIRPLRPRPPPSKTCLEALPPELLSMILDELVSGAIASASSWRDRFKALEARTRLHTAYFSYNQTHAAELQAPCLDAVATMDAMRNSRALLRKGWEGRHDKAYQVVRNETVIVGRMMGFWRETRWLDSPLGAAIVGVLGPEAEKWIGQGRPKWTYLEWMDGEVERTGKIEGGVHSSGDGGAELTSLFD